MPIEEQYCLTMVSEILIRQAHPKADFDEQGRLGSTAFKSSRSHNFQLSVERASRTTPTEATMRYLSQGRATQGAWGVAVEECHRAGVKAYEDAEPDHHAHAVIDQKPLGSNERSRVATKLAACARERGCLFHARDVSLPSLAEIATVEGEATCETIHDLMDDAS